MEPRMKTMTTARKVLTVAVATAALAVSFLSATNSADARYFCNWTPRGTVCNWAP
jgi:hypothetical protein